MTDEFIKYRVNQEMRKLSLRRLREKSRLFQVVDLPLLSIKFKVVPERVSRKTLRYYLDLIHVWYPMDKYMDNEHKAKLISQIFNCTCTKEDLDQLRSFKVITKKEVLTMRDENVVTITRLRWRSRNNVAKNIIHFQT